MKKKFTMLFAALLACVGVMAQVTNLEQLSNDAKYVITSDRCYLTYTSANGEVLSTSNGNNAVAFALNNANHQFQIIKDGENYYLYSVGAAKYVDKNGKLSETATDALTLDDVSSTYANYPWKLCIGGNGLNSQNAGQAAAGIMVNSWTTADAGNCYVIYDVASYTAFPVTNNFYVIECPLFESVQGVKKALYVNGEGKAVWGTEDLTNNNHYWIPTVNAETGEVALKNFGTNTYLSKTDGTMTSEIANATLKPLGGNLFNINLTNASEALHANGHGGGASATGTLTNWNGGIGSASAWTFVQKNDPTALAEVTVNYSFTYGGVEKYTQETTTLVGEEWPAITTAFPFGVSATKPAGEVSAEGAVDGKVTKVIELAVNLPFTYAADYASIENWYYMNIHTDHYYLNYAEGESMALTATAVPADQKDAYSWAFIGNPFDGYQLVNKAAGEGYILSSSTTMEGNNGGGTYPTLTATPVAEGNNTHWIPTASSHRENGFFLAQKNNASNRMNKRDGKLAYWTTGADAGSAFVVELRDDAAALQAVIDNAAALLASWNGTTVGYLNASEEDKAAVSEAIAAAEAAIANKTGYDAAEVALKAAVAAAKPYTIQPEEGVFYALKNNYTGRYMNVSASAGLIATTAVGIGEVFQFVKDNGNLYLKNVERGTYLNTALPHGWGQNAAGATTLAEAKAVVVENLGKDNQVSITPVGGGQLHHDTNNNNVVAWNNIVDSKSSWSIEAVDITALSHVVSISDVKWATLVLGYDAIIPAGVTAYAVTEAGNGVAELTEVTGVLPAYEAVLLNATEAGSYSFKYAESAEAVEGNLLAGSTIDMNVEGLGYVLAAKEGNVGLYKAALNVSTDKTNDGTEEEPAVTYEAFKNNAFKAYLPVAGENAPAMFTLGRGGDDESTGIDQLINNGEVVIYDLAGRRVEKMEKGIYIVNGKKVVK